MSVVPLGMPGATLVILGKRQMGADLAVQGFARLHRLTGGEARVKSYKSLMTQLLKAADRQEKNNNDVALLYGGDWNEGTRSHGVGSPRATRR